MSEPALESGHGRLALLAAFLAGAGALGLLLGLAALATVELGLYDTRASKQHGALVSWGVHSTFIHSTRREARGRPAPQRFSAAQAAAGLRLYVAHCEQCHGGPATPRASWAGGMNPTPPFLLDSARRWTSAELNAIISDGVKMTAMPAWRYALSDADRWDLVAFLETLPQTPPADYVQARAAAQAAAGEVRP